MSRLTDEQKKAADNAKRRWDKIADALGVATAGSALGSLGDPMIAAELLKIGGLLYAMAKGLANEEGRAADDPPRDDFASSTFFTRRKLDLSVFGEGPITTPAVRLSDRALDASGYLRAMVRALERSQGAELRDQPRHIASRTAEALEFAQAAGESLRRTSEGADTLAAAFETSAFQPEGGSEGTPRPQFVWRRLDEVLPPESLAMLYRSGVRIEEVRAGVRGTVPADPGRELANELRAGAVATAAFADQLDGGLAIES